MARETNKKKLFSFAKLSEVLDVTPLLEIQFNSFKWFKEEGLRDLFKGTFPIEDFTGKLSLDLLGYEFEKPRFTIGECRDRDMHYAESLRVTFRLRYKETGEIKEQEVLLGDIPALTPNGTFIVNGAERVVVSQLTRSPSVYYKEILHKGEGRTYYAKLIPNRGTMLELENDLAGAVWMKMERSRKMPATMILKALGYGTSADIAKLFAKQQMFHSPKYSQILGQVTAHKVVDPKTDEVILSADQFVDEESAKKIEMRVKEITLHIVEPAILETLKQDHTGNQSEALIELCKKLRPGDPPTLESAKTLFQGLFFDKRRYDLSFVGRYKLNKKFERYRQNLFPGGLKETVLVKEDFLDMVRYLVDLMHGEADTDDVDHLGNRRVRSVGELLVNQLRVGLLRMEKVVKERMMIQDKETMTPQSLVNIRPVVATINEFFGTSPLSQFMDQTNPLAELTHKRRLSALGPGGLSRERAGFEVRDVHHSHYGRICPIETPEGPNIGLINSLSTYAKVNPYGFIESPYRRVKKGHVTDEIIYLTADEEDQHVVAQANAPLTADGKFAQTKVVSRYRHEHRLTNGDEIEYMDVSPKQVVSVSASLIPFLEHDDANRALMGSNMQRQAVPLVQTEQPFILTGMEGRVSQDSGTVVLAKNSGTVVKISAKDIVVESQDGSKDLYDLRKFEHSNQGTCINQKPAVERGEKVKKGQVLADGPSTRDGGLALGKNVLAAFMPWEGYNFEDAIVISERMVGEDIFTSIHIEEYETEARDTKLGPEEITRDTPNVSEDQLKDLDEQGIVRIGADVQSEDILVGKITPKGETELTPEERLLRAIFGEKAREMRDTSLRVPHGGKGKVVKIKHFKRKEGHELPPGVNELVRIYVAQKRKVSVGDKMAGRHGNKGVIAKILPAEDMPYLPDGTPVDVVLNPLGVPSRMNPGQILEAHLGWVTHHLGIHLESPVFDGAREKEIKDILAIVDLVMDGWVKLYRGDTPVGLLHLDGVTVAEEREAIGNAEKLAKLFQKAEVHFFDPAGKNILATLNFSHLSPQEIIESWTANFWAKGKLAVSKNSSYTAAQIREIFEEAYFKETGKSRLHSGKTGEPFDGEVTVGYLYIMKLAHLVDDKIHARSTGPYALVTQQPLGGKAQFGGQRFGEMEVWALEAYGAASTLQELLTVKSDDVVGRVKTYEAIIKGEPVLEPGVPESFKVLVKELQSLGIDVRLIAEDKEVEIPEIEEEVVEVDKELERELA